MNSRNLKVAYFTIALFEILGHIDSLPFKFFTHITKPLLMPVLALFFYFQTKLSQNNSQKLLINTALFFAWLGDDLLMFSDKNPFFFMLGLASFLVMQLLYIKIFKLFSLKGLIAKAQFSIPIIVAGFGLLVFLFPNLGGLKIPVILYFVAILSMVMSSICYWNRTRKAEKIFWGALLFMVSDSLIAINKFQFPIIFSGFLIMTTYIIAQWLIIDGLSKEIS